MDVHNKLKQEAEQKQKEKEAKTKSLEKQLKMWEARLKELRNVGSSALDPAFVRRQADKCSEEITRINRIISTL